MSRVIKGAIYDDEPLVVAVPVSLTEKGDAEGENGNQLMTPEDQEHLMAEIHAKEEKASQLLKDAQVQAEILRQEGKAQADKLLLDAQAQVESIQEEARQKGYEQGLEEGRKAGQEQVLQEQHHILVEGNSNAERTLAEARESCRDYVIGAENAIAEMVLKIANKVLPQHFIDMPQMILPLVQEAIQKVKDQPHVIVRVAPESYELVMMAQSEFQAMLEGSGTLEVKSDESLKSGDCLIESPNGLVDAGISTQLGLIEKAVRNVME